ncbi:MAG: 2-oxoacid:acceptor oxidoreductase subunit alpha [Candidatus Thermoplasmatota archaeon]|nr:2-oxoacid:acceptor oxidoreductase subunit alpha [Candidatus Thermoplasmatota archaeon]
MTEKLNMILGGAQGSGLETTIQILSTAFASSGNGFLADREYFSNIKGRHSYAHAKISAEDIPRSIDSKIGLLGCMDAETLFTHFEDLVDGGYLIYDTSTEDKTQDSIKSIEDPLRERLEERFNEIGIDGTISSLVEYLKEEKNVEVIELDYPSILEDIQKEFDISSSQASRYVSSILIGAVAGLMGLEKEQVDKGIERKFEGKEKIAKQNIFLVEKVNEMVREEHGSPLKLEGAKLDEDELLMVNGNEIIGMGKITGGMRFQSYYPITPAADESFFIEQHASFEDEGSVLVFQTEDELAAITSCIGAALTGTRSATATSGPGFALMVEGLGWAGINEVPIVITYYQRGGPSTGQPTRGSQDDLMNVLYSSHGNFPRIVLVSGDHEEAFDDAVKAFNLAEKYQTPVIHLMDKFLANIVKTIPVPEIEGKKIDRGKLFDRKDYKRFADGPISERGFLGSEVMWYTGSEHDAEGNVSEDPENRIRMHEKRMKKLKIADEEMDDRAIYFGPEEAENLIVGWGSVKGAILDAIDEMKEDFGYLHFRCFSPFPAKKVSSILEKSEVVIAVEHSYSPRVSEVVSLKTGYQIEKEVVKFTGRPIYRDELIDSLVNIIEGSDREVLKHGP